MMRWIVVYYLLSLSILVLLGSCKKKDDNASIFSNSITGIDISHHNGSIDYKLLKDKNINFVYIKSTEGTSVIDKKYKQNNIGTRAENIKTGAYHFFIFSEEGTKQANHFLNNSDIRSKDLIPVLDIEYSKNNPISNDTTYLNKIRSEILNYCNLIEEKTGEYPIIYCNNEMYKKLNLHKKKIKYWIVDLNKQPVDSINWVLWQFEHEKKLNQNISVNYSRTRENSNVLNNILLKY